MTARQIAAQALAIGRPGSSPLNWRRLAAAGGALALLAAPGALGDLTRSVAVDAYLGVTVFVAATLLLFYGLERACRVDLAAALGRHRVWQVPVAACLGALPGCGGAIIVVAAYARQRVGFGAVMAALTATMGDAAFLLIATRPDAAMVVIPVTLLAGVLFGWLADAAMPNPPRVATDAQCALPSRIGRLRLRDMAFLLLAAPGLIFGVLDIAQVNLGAPLTGVSGDMALAGIVLTLTIWAVSPLGASAHPDEHSLTRTGEETSFVTAWVLAGFLLYEYAATFLGIDLTLAAQSAAPLVPLIAILIGFIPGCGPQVLMVTAYINGIIPFSALIGNAISNDGDALFPAIAISPRVAILATLYSAAPALVVAYGFYLSGFSP